MKMNESLELLNIEQTSNYLNLSVAKLRADIFYKRIPHLKIGGLIRFKKMDLDFWLESKRVKVGFED